MLFASETWRLKENEMTILRKPEKVITKVMCGIKLKEKRSSQEVMDLLSSEETLNRQDKANRMRWYGHH